MLTYAFNPNMTIGLQDAVQTKQLQKGKKSEARISRGSQMTHIDRHAVIYSIYTFMF